MAVERCEGRGGGFLRGVKVEVVGVTREEAVFAQPLGAVDVELSTHRSRQ